MVLRHFSGVVWSAGVDGHGKSTHIGILIGAVRSLSLKFALIFMFLVLLRFISLVDYDFVLSGLPRVSLGTYFPCCDLDFFSIAHIRGDSMSRTSGASYFVIGFRFIWSLSATLTVILIRCVRLKLKE